MGAIHVKTSDRLMFESIHYDKAFIYIGKKDKVDYEPDAGLYNLVASHFHSKNKLEVFHAWLLQSNKYFNRIEPKLIQWWEESVKNIAENNIYTDTLRIKYSNKCIEFYGLLGSNNPTELKYLTTTSNRNFRSTLIQYLKYDLSVIKICRKKSYKPMAKSNMEISKEIDITMQYDMLPIIDKIETLANDKDQYCLAYYNLEQGNPENNTPAWDSFINTMLDNGSRECFKAWLYSVFVGKNTGRQALWLYGRGNTGKSIIAETISNRLSMINEDICSNLVDTWHIDKYTSSSFVNKRFIKVPDTKDRALIRLNLLKNITGNDSINTRSMNSAEKTNKVYAKVMVTSNSRPFINTELSEELSRILFIEIDSKASYEANAAWDSNTYGNWANALLDEIDDFIVKCKTDYQSLLQKNGHDIKPYSAMIERIEEGDFFIKRDIELWWGSCVRKSDNPNAVLNLSDAAKDITRFMAPMNQSGKYTNLIRRFLVTILRNKKVLIYDLEIANTRFIQGYEYVKSDPKYRKTVQQLIKDKEVEIMENGNNQEEIYI